MPSKPDSIQLHREDNIAIAARDLRAGCKINDFTLPIDIRVGHKIALESISKGGRIYKYGQTIGFATCDIIPGQWVHTHNVSADEFTRDYAFASEVPPDPQPITDRTFMGYRRPDGSAGTRNYIAIVSSVNCSASVSKYVAQRFDEKVLRDYPNIDGVIPLTHKGGCTGSHPGHPDYEQLQRVLAGFAKHANVGGHLLIGLGCESNNVTQMMRNGRMLQGHGPPDAPPLFTMQETGGTAKTVEAATRALADLLPQANDIKREPIPASELILALECGGSDGNSGVTANPALGIAADMLVAAGGTAILAETPEVYGAEHQLTRRAVNEKVGRKLIDLIKWWKDYTAFFDLTIDNNPSPGNKEGGLTTIYEKSLGAVTKAGHTALREVYHYADQVKEKGFVFMDSPGNDPASVTGMVAGGANMVCFTTGRGSCFGCKPVPSIKIASNTSMYQIMEDDMDINAGVIYEGVSIEQVGHDIFEMILRVASGELTKSEKHGVGEEEFFPWSIGPVL
jgi:altronate hydrolase